MKTLEDKVGNLGIATFAIGFLMTSEAVSTFLMVIGFGLVVAANILLSEKR